MNQRVKKVFGWRSRVRGFILKDSLSLPERESYFFPPPPHLFAYHGFFYYCPYRTQLKLETLEDAVVINDDDDTLDDKHGCPAYVSPEILMTNGGYSGKAADVWSMGVMLYAMLVGRYPFHDAEHNTLFNKIRCGHYTIPDTISSKAKCLIRNLLRHNPAERLTVEDILLHPWFRSPTVRVAETRPAQDGNRPDQLVPTGWEWA